MPSLVNAEAHWRHLCFFSFILALLLLLYNGRISKHAERPREPTDCRLGEVHMPLQGQALKTVARPLADEHPLETCGLRRGHNRFRDRFAP